jgi:hypothetical protein
MMQERFYGMYRGRVLSNRDDLRLGRLQVQVTDVPGASDESWARPCIGYAAGDEGFFALPPERALVWVMFEAGNPSDPIWMGGYWDNTNRPPSMQATASEKVFKSQGLTITLNDLPNGASLDIELKGGPKIKLGPQGVEIDNGKNATIKMEGPTISLNGDSFKVLK